ncbi:MAG: ABC-F family ATP-binding cassette domain-containing protein [Chloroflexota bacterium]
MSILRLEGVRREIGDFVILDSVNGSIARGERVGLVGANGAGKTTLLTIIAGREEADGGKVHVATGQRVGLLSQEANLDAVFMAAPDVHAAVRSGAGEVLALEARLRELEHAGAEAVSGQEYARLRERFEALDGYHLDQRIDETLGGLGVPREDWGRPPLQLSGGEQTRVALARLLVADPDLLMLDEPTNHLDIAALEWLEAALARRDGALLVASHDRAFLDAVVTRIWELRDRRLVPFRGGYSQYLVQREEADARQRKDAETQADDIAREQELVQRYRSQRKHVKMHEHERRLEALQGSRVTARRKDHRLALPTAALLGTGPERSGEIAVNVEGLVAGFPRTPERPGGIPVVAVSRLEAARGERIGLVGPNGAGKTTLLRTIAGELPALEGFVRLGHNTTPGYLAQVRRAGVPGATVLDAILSAAHVDIGPARSYLARFLFRGDDVLKPVSELSGGERSRLELAVLGITPANLLLLDEPTNHLDIPAREALESFLRESPATILVVSHDRRLLESVCERLWVVEPGVGEAPGRAAPFDGGYRAWRTAVTEGWTVSGELARRAGATRPATGGTAVKGAPAGKGSATSTKGGAAGGAATSANGTGNGRPGGSGAATSRASKAPPLSKDAYRRQIGRIEEDMTRLGLRKSQLELALGDPGVHANFVELRRLTSELADVDAALAQAEEAWLALSERAPR